MNLREQAESDLAFTLEGEWGLPVVLISPDGVTQDKSANNPTADLDGQVIYDTLVQQPDTGAEMLVHKPVVTLRISSLTRVPKSGERWIVKIPITPNRTAPKETFFLERPTEDGSSIGFIRLYLMATEQVTP
jgi:hypothetical protein